MPHALEMVHFCAEMAQRDLQFRVSKGVHGVFMETHPRLMEDPALNAPQLGENQLKGMNDV